MPLTVDQQLESLAITILEARWHFQIWEALQELRSDATAVDMMNKYLNFFRPTQAAHFDSTIVDCYQLFETRADTVSFPTLKIALKEAEGRDVDSDKSLVSLQDQIRPIWVRIAMIRNNSIGHYSSEHPQTDLFESAKLSPKDVWQFLDLVVELHRRITRPRDGSVEAFNINGKPATVGLVDALKRLQ